jgi:hypothetical protein
MADNTSAENLGREMFNQLITAAPDRFIDINHADTGYNYNAEEDGYYKMPIIAGDTITYKVTLQPAVGQDAAVATGGSATERTYKVILTVGA